MNNQRSGYRRPNQSRYAKGSWWTAHAAEVIGAFGGFMVGFLLLVPIIAAVPSAELGWVPWVTTLIGALGLRAVVRRQFKIPEHGPEEGCGLRVPDA